jgi:transcriptional regulator GlxA family with amidase domain
VHVVIYLPLHFYAGIAATIVETLQAVNDLSGSETFTFEFVKTQKRAVSKSGISFPANDQPSKKMDVLILLSGLRGEMTETLSLLEGESERARPFIEMGREQGSIIATTCGAAYLVAASGLLDGKKATISWWLKREASHRFPKVRWEPQRLIVRVGRIYTTGAAFAGLELITRLLVDLGFSKEERHVRKLLVLPPSRQFQSPYEMPFFEELDPFERNLDRLSREHLSELSLQSLAEHLGTSTRTLSRKFFSELQTSPGKWIQRKRLETARALLETTQLTVSQICYKIGYQDLASFSRLFARDTGMTPGEFRKQLKR